MRGIPNFKEVIRAPSLLFAAGWSLCGSKIMEPRSGVGGRSEAAFPAVVASTRAGQEAAFPAVVASTSAGQEPPSLPS